MNAAPSQTNTTSFPNLSRVVFFDGERLAADDLNAAATVQRELRWLHNRSLHSWGIALGFAVTGTTGDKQVVVSPGYGVDCSGREVILTDPIIKVVPSRADNGYGKPVTYFLVAAYPDDSALPVLEERQGECGTAGAVRLQEQASVYWKAQDEQLSTGFELVLAQVQIQNCQLAAPLDVDQRRSARPPQQPFVAAGATDAGNTAWRPMLAPAAPNVIIGLQALVDTTSARFSTPPVYQAMLAGNRYMRHDARVGTAPFLVDGSTFVSDSTSNNFLFNVLMPRDLTGFAPPTANMSALILNPSALFSNQASVLLDIVTQNWWVEWIGTEG